MGITRIYRWNGKYFGFIYNGKFFRSSSEYLGWVDDENKVWRADGRYLGEIVEDNYILKRTGVIEPLPRIPIIPPVPPIPPIPAINRVGHISKVGWQDALDEYK